MDEVDEFGIPIKKTATKKQAVDEFGIPIKKKGSSEPTSQKGAVVSPTKPIQQSTSSDTEPPTRAQASVALGGPTKLFGQEEEKRPTSIMYGNEPKKEGFVPPSTPIDIDQSIKYLEKKKSNPKELKRLKEEKAKMPEQKPIEYYLNKQIVNNLTPAIDQANTITEEDKLERDSEFENDWNKTGFVNRLNQFGSDILGSSVNLFNKLGFIDESMTKEDIAIEPLKKYKDEVIKYATENKVKLSPEQFKIKVQEMYNNDWDTDKKAYNLTQLNYTLTDEEQKAIKEDKFDNYKDLNTSQKYFLNTASTLSNVRDNIGLDLVSLDKELSEKIKNGQTLTENEIQSYNNLTEKYKQYHLDAQNAYGKYAKNLDKVHSLETELDVFDNENLRSIEFLKRLGIAVEQLGVGAIDFTSYLANLHAKSSPLNTSSREISMYLHEKANDLRGAIEEQNKGLRDTSNRFESVLSKSVDFITENTPMVLGLLYGGAPAMYGLAGITTGEKYGETVNENKDYNEFQEVVAPLLHGGAMLIPLSKQLKTIQNSGRVLLAGEKEFPKIIENVYKEKAANLFSKIKTFAGESFDLGNQLKLMTILQEVNNSVVLGKDINFEAISDLDVYATAPLLHGMNKFAPYLTGKVTEPFMSKEDYKIIDENTSQIFDLNKKLESGELDINEADIVKQTIKDISAKSAEVVNNKLDRIGKYNKETVDNILDATKQASDLREKANRIISSENIDAKQKEVVIKKLRGEYNSIEQTKAELISGNAKNIIYVKKATDIPIEAKRVKGAQYKVVENSIEKKLFEKQQMSVNAPAVEVTPTEVKAEEITTTEVTPTDVKAEEVKPAEENQYAKASFYFSKDNAEGNSEPVSIQEQKDHDNIIQKIVDKGVENNDSAEKIRDKVYKYLRNNGVLLGGFETFGIKEYVNGKVEGTLKTDFVDYRKPPSKPKEVEPTEAKAEEVKTVIHNEIEYTKNEAGNWVNTKTGNEIKGIGEKGKDLIKTLDDLAKPAEVKEIVAPKEDLTAGKGLFSEPVEHVIKTAEDYKKSKGITIDAGERITDIDVENSKKIADAYDKMESNPNDPEVKAAYNAMANETVDQFKHLIDNGYTVELYDGKTEPYKNSEEMLKDLRDNKHLYVFSTEEGFGDTPITEKDRQENPLLKDSGFTDKNGKKLLINDAFRFVHDIFGHGERGNSFGAKGEENAWDVHSRMYSPEARRAMTTETRGQNSWVNFNKEMRNEDGSIKKKGDKGYLSPTERPFADQKIGLLPEWVSKSIYETAEKPIEPTKKYTEKAKELADKVRNTDLPDWLKANIEGGKKQGVDADTMKETLAKAIEKTGELMDKGVEFAEAVKESVKEMVDLLGEDKRVSIEKDFSDYYNSIKEPIPTEAPKTTSVKNAVVAAEREAKGKEPIEQREKYSSKVNYEETKAKVDSGEILPRDLASAIVNNPKGVAITSEVSDALAYDRMRLSNEYNNVLKDIVENPNDPANIIARDRLEKQMEDNDQASRYSGTISSHALLARKNVIKQDYSLDRMILRYKAATGGKISDNVRAKLEVMSKKLEEANAKLEQYESKESERLAIKALVEIKKEVRQQKRTESKENLKKEREDLYTKLREIRKEQMSRLSANPLPVEMVPIISKLAKNLIMDGVLTLDGVVDEIHTNLKDIFDDVQKRDIRDALSGYGNFKLPSKDEIDVQLREIKSQGRLISAYEDAQSGKAPLKTGLQRDAPSDIVRELQRQVQEMMKQNGITRESLSAESTWKTALDGIKTRLKNQIRDLEKQIATGEKTPKKQGVAYDAEATALKEQRDSLKKIIEDTEGKREISDEQRVKIAVSAVEKSIAEYERRISERDIAPKEKGVKTPETPELKILKDIRENLKKEYDQMKEEIDPKKTPEERALASIKTRLNNRAAELQNMLDSGNFEKKKRTPTPLDKEAMDLKANVERIKNKVDIEIKKEEQKNRTKYEKTLDFISGWRRTMLLTGVKVLGKLQTAAMTRSTISPIEEIIGGVLSKIPGISKISEKAPRQGGGFVAKAELKAISQWWQKATYQDMLEIAKSGKGMLDLLHGKKDDLPPSVLDIFGQLHQALKQPAKRNEYFRSFEKRLAHANRNGIDVTDPMVQLTIGTEAYLDANRAIFMQENIVTQGYKSFLSSLERGGNVGKTGAAFAKIILPIVKVPTNYVGEVTSYSGGYAKALPLITKAIFKGVESLSPEQSDYVMRNLKKGSLGAAFIALGYFNAQAIGGYYQRGEKRKEDEVDAGGLRLFGEDMPKWLVHTPLLECLQIGSTLKRVQDSYDKKGKEEEAKLAAGLAVAKGLVEEVPFARSPEEALRALGSTKQFKTYTRDLLESMINPQLTKELFDLEILPKIEGKEGKISMEELKVKSPAMYKIIMKLKKGAK